MGLINQLITGGPHIVPSGKLTVCELENHHLVRWKIIHIKKVGWMFQFANCECLKKAGYHEDVQTKKVVWRSPAAKKSLTSTSAASPEGER